MRNNPIAQKISTGKKETLTLAGVIFTALVTAFLISLFVASLGVVAGPSMEDTLTDGDLILIFKLSREYEKGDVVVVDLPELSRRGTVVKRITATQGDHVLINSQGELYVNSELILTFSEGSFCPMDTVMDSGEIFLTGDNLSQSVDSRSEGFPRVTKDDIVGKVVLRLFPKIEKI